MDFIVLVSMCVVRDDPDLFTCREKDCREDKNFFQNYSGSTQVLRIAVPNYMIKNRGTDFRAAIALPIRRVSIVTHISIL